MSKTFFTVSEILKPGKGNEVHLRQLCNYFNQKPVAVKRQIKQERLNGSLICSNRKGYFMASSPEEIEEFVKAEEFQALSRLAITKPFRDKLKDLPDQQHFDDLFNFTEG